MAELYSASARARDAPESLLESDGLSTTRRLPYLTKLLTFTFERLRCRTEGRSKTSVNSDPIRTLIAYTCEINNW